MKIVIIEDEPLVAKDLSNLLTRVAPDAEIVKILSGVEEGKNWLSENRTFDLILSDIQLSDGTSFDIYDHVKIDQPIIFTTAYDDYAIRAFKLNSIDYLLKPVDGSELAAAINKYKSLTTDGILSEQLKALMAGWNSNPSRKYKERFLTLHRNTLIPVNQNDIAFFHKEELIHLYTLTNEKYISEHQTLDEVEMLINPDYFFRANRQYILHINAVGKIRTTHKGLTVQLKPPFNLEIDISREKATAFKNWIA